MDVVLIADPSIQAQDEKPFRDNNVFIMVEDVGLYGDACHATEVLIQIEEASIPSVEEIIGLLNHLFKMHL